MLTKEQILLISDKALKEVQVPEWSGSVFIRGMTIEDVDFCQSLTDQDSQSLEKMIIRFVCDDQGVSLFIEDDLPLLKKKSIQAFRRIVNEIKAFNSLEEAEKNSDSTPA
jgi:hypothetical protein